MSLNSRHNAAGFSSKGDVVLIKDGHSKFIAGKVMLHASVDGVPVSLVSCWQLHSIRHGTAKWHVRDDSNMLIETTDILDSVTHTKLSHKLVTTILPPEFR